jgi:ABC-type branched-subunit amino acid transport system permease subunit
MRDSETAARSIGIDLRRSKLFVFGISSAMAGVGGALLTQADQNWDVTTFNPVFGLFWFVVVVVAGVASIRGAILAAVLYVVIPRVTDLPVLASIGVFGLLAALALGRMPGGLVGLAERLPARAWRAAAASAAAAPAPVGAGLVPSEFAQRLLAEPSSVRGKPT